MTKLVSLFAACLLMLCAFSCTSNSNKAVVSETPNAEQNDSVSAPTADDRQYLVKVGDMAPDFEIEFPDGSKTTLSALRGKVVMLQFTASWCGVCRKEMPHIESEIWQRHKDNAEFALIGIDREEPVEKINELIEATGVTYPIGFDPKADIFALYAEREAGITRNVIVDRDGRIVMLTRLYEEEEFARMVALIDELLAK